MSRRALSRLPGAGASASATAPRSSRQSRWALGVPFVVVHVACAGAFFAGCSVSAVVALGVSYVMRAFGITAFYHRCLAHRAFRARRSVQLLGTVLGAAAAQRGPLWWVGHHREHHLYTDREGDPHSPVVDGFAYSHVLWIFDRANAQTRSGRVGDLARFPELVFLDRFEYLAPATLLGACLGAGALLALYAPGLHTGPLQMAVWGFALPTVALYHSTFAVNSLAHRFGRRRFNTKDDSRNNWLIAGLVLGEGWHNNHHRFPNSARQGLAWYELDPTWWGIRLMARAALVSDVHLPSPSALRDAQGSPGGVCQKQPRTSASSSARLPL